MFEQLTTDDYDDLLTALDKWGEADKSSKLFQSMIDSLLTREGEGIRSKVDSDMEKQKADFSKTAEKIVLLKAKLIKLRDALDIEDFVSEIEDVS